jgi:hypothetical protein
METTESTTSCTRFVTNPLKSRFPFFFTSSCKIIRYGNMYINQFVYSRHYHVTILSCYLQMLIISHPSNECHMSPRPLYDYHSNFTEAPYYAVPSIPLSFPPSQDLIFSSVGVLCSQTDLLSVLISTLSCGVWSPSWFTCLEYAPNRRLGGLTMITVSGMLRNEWKCILEQLSHRPPFTRHGSLTRLVKDFRLAIMSQFSVTDYIYLYSNYTE